MSKLALISYSTFPYRNSNLKWGIPVLVGSFTEIEILQCVLQSASPPLPLTFSGRKFVSCKRSCTSYLSPNPMILKQLFSQTMSFFLNPSFYILWKQMHCGSRNTEHFAGGFDTFWDRIRSPSLLLKNESCCLQTRSHSKEGVKINDG